MFLASYVFFLVCWRGIRVHRGQDAGKEEKIRWQNITPTDAQTSSIFKENRLGVICAHLIFSLLSLSLLSLLTQWPSQQLLIQKWGHGVRSE